MLNKAIALTSLVTVIYITACSSPATPPEPEPIEVTSEVQVTVEVTREVTQDVEVTRVVQVPVTVTFTPGPSPTPTVTPTPTETPTSTPSATPFGTAGCVNLRSVSNFWNIDADDYEARLFPTYDALDGKCVRFFASQDLGIVATDYGWLSYSRGLDFTFVVDDSTPPGVRSVPSFSTVWGIWHSRGGGEYEIDLRRVEAFDALRQPIEDDGFFMVGEDWDVSAGQWKSLWPPGQIDSCYWARTNPDTGDIRNNHFGQAGVYARIYDGDLFESDDCAPWVFVAP